ncbi:unnamed protein product [Cyprideis torosa]|uniref:Sterile alpha motif domain-containing protein 5 n=1 Tax=Cyprideis torosa TaxID=163714 RepID=A0A7R8WD17_9CRUS|nr:unnamed protein product [Cyprideis torosa]CAG0892647.1 unnamed protein product [Cyprideis torosa]
MAVEAENIVEEWLRALHLGYYAESFIENGYDDLEICKQIGPADLDAIGVFSTPHRARILEAVKSLREEGATSVYFTLDEVAHDECNCTESESNGFLGSSRASSQRTTRSSRMSSPRTSSTRMSSRSEPGMGGLQGTATSTGGGSGTVLSDDEERLVAIPKNQLRILLKEKLMKDGVRLSYPPYSKSVSTLGGITTLTPDDAPHAVMSTIDIDSVTLVILLVDHGGLRSSLERKRWNQMEPTVAVVNRSTHFLFLRPKTMGQKETCPLRLSSRLLAHSFWHSPHVFPAGLDTIIPVRKA